MIFFTFVYFFFRHIFKYLNQQYSNEYVLYLCKHNVFSLSLSHLSSSGRVLFDESPPVSTVNTVFVNRSTTGSVFVIFQTAFCSQIPFDWNEYDNLKLDFQKKFILFQRGLIVAQKSALFFFFFSAHMFNLIQHLWLFFLHSPAWRLLHAY